MKNILSALFFATLMIPLCAQARSARELVEVVESSTLEQQLVDAVIKSRGLHCDRPNLVKHSNQLNVENFRVRYQCQSQIDARVTSTITVGGDIEDSQVTMTYFNFSRN